MFFKIIHVPTVTFAHLIFNYVTSPTYETCRSRINGLKQILKGIILF